MNALSVGKAREGTRSGLRSSQNCSLQSTNQPEVNDNQRQAEKIGLIGRVQQLGPGQAQKCIDERLCECGIIDMKRQATDPAAGG